MLVYLLLAAVAVIIFKGLFSALTDIEGFAVDESGPSSTCSDLAQQNASNIIAIKKGLSEFMSPTDDDGIRSEIANLTDQAKANAAQLKQMANEIHNQARKLIGVNNASEVKVSGLH